MCMYLMPVITQNCNMKHKGQKEVQIIINKLEGLGVGKIGERGQLYGNRWKLDLVVVITL